MKKDADSIDFDLFFIFSFKLYSNLRLLESN